MMDRPRWTPFAWEKRDLFVFADPRIDGRVIAKFDLHDVGHEQAHANAQLSAAAPDLAKAAAPLIDRILDEKLVEWPDNKQIVVPLGELRALFAAYRKALGET